jgi:Phage protein (N4 Gp49/phage Sf6 gene 66) family
MDLEELISSKAKAPRISESHIDSVIVGKTFTTLPSGKVMICEITLTNGFTVRGEAAVVNKENFNQEIGERISFGNARQKIWELEGYLLQEATFLCK